MSTGTQKPSVKRIIMGLLEDCKVSVRFERAHRVTWKFVVNVNVVILTITAYPENHSTKTFVEEQ